VRKIRRWKKLVFWLTGSAVFLVALPYIFAFLIVEVLLLSSYRNLALGNLLDASVNSSVALTVAQALYPPTSKYYQDIFLYDLKLWAKTGIMGGSYTLPSGANFTTKKVREFEQLNKMELSYEDMAKIKIEGARVANATTHGDGVSLALDIANNTSSQNYILTAHANEEVAYRKLTGLFSTLSPQNEKHRKQNEVIADVALEEHGAAQRIVCKMDNYQCRFNELRWDVGVCIRRAYLKELPICETETLFKVTNFTGAACKGLSSNQCYAVMDGLMPYFHQLLQAQGKGFIGLLKLKTHADSMPRELF